MNTGHEGSMTTVHANTARDALSRVETMVGMGSISLSETLTRQTISRAINIILQLTRGTDGRRRISSITEIIGMEGAVITTQEIFKFDQRGVDKDGKILGEYRSTGLRAKAMEKIERAGIDPQEIVRPLLEG
jgi:pilus assembly protein CpaF